MGDPKGFLKYDRNPPSRRPVEVRLRDWKEVEVRPLARDLAQQAARCMDCGIPFCNAGCPLGNIIPDWNDLVYRDRWEDALERLHATNNFPEFTGRLCPAPCEGACVAGVNTDPIMIKSIELAIVERGWEMGWIVPVVPSNSTGKRVAVVGSGPAGLAAAQQLTRAGHAVTVLERADRLGGLMRYGIPEFKMEKSVIDRRIAQMELEGTEFRVNQWVGGPTDNPTSIDPADVVDDYDAVVLAGGATQWRDLPIPGRDLSGVYQAMEYLPPSNQVQAGDLPRSPIDARDQRVVVIGGGDTGADCLGTALRQGAKSVHQFEIMDRPPDERGPDSPWPTYPRVFKVSSAHEEGGERLFAVSTTEFLGENGRLVGLRAEKVEGRAPFTPIPGSEFELEVDLVFLAMGFVGPESSPLIDGLATDNRGNVNRDAGWATSSPGVFVCGDMGRGQSLIVWAIAEGRATAAAVDLFLMGESLLPRPVRPNDRPLS